MGEAIPQRVNIPSSMNQYLSAGIEKLLCVVPLGWWSPLRPQNVQHSLVLLNFIDMIRASLQIRSHLEQSHLTLKSNETFKIN